MKKRPLVSIIIVNWNKKEMTGRCLKTLKMTKYNNYEVVLIDNGSTDGSVEYLKKIMPRIHVTKLKKNYGYTEGTNVGWKYSMDKLGAKYLCVMDNDIETIQPEWLDLLIDEIEKSLKIGLASGKHLYKDGRLQTPFLEADLNDSNKKDTGKYEYVKLVSGYVGPCMIIRCSMIKKIGYYDENFFYGPNDIDYCYRVKKAGYNIVYNGLSKSIHLGSVSGIMKGPKTDFLYEKQAESMMIFSFRYGSLPEKIRMVFQQFVRAFVTRKDTVASRNWSNLLFYSSFPKRVFSYFIALFKALKNYKDIKTSNYKEKLL